jgi:hypothetical protein
MTNAEIEAAMETLPDIVGDALYNFKTAIIDKERLCAKTFLEIKARSAGEKITVAEIEAMVKADVDCYKAALNEVEKESEYTKWNEKLMAAKKMAAMRTAF